MKRVFVLISLAVAILVIVGNVFAQDKISNIPEPSLDPAEWKLVFTGSNGTTFYVNTREITYLPEGIVKVRVLWVPREETRRTIVNALKKDLLFKREDPNNAERLWYYIELDKVNCKTHQYATLEVTAYSFGRADLDYLSFQPEEWENIIPGSAGEKLEKYVCNETPPSISEPSLSSEWKLIFTDSDGGTTYVNTRRINYLPEGIVKVWILDVSRGESRERLVNSLKNDLTFKGKDPNNAERYWYFKSLDKINCRTHQFALLEMVHYSFKETVLDSHSFQHEKWDRIVPGSLWDGIEKYVCKKHKEKK